MGNSNKCLSQRYSDALPHRESNQGFATFRLLYSALLIELRRRQPRDDLFLIRPVCL